MFLVLDQKTCELRRKHYIYESGLFFGAIHHFVFFAAMEHLHIPIQTSALFGSIPLLAPLATDAKPSIPQPPDDAAVLIAKCGEPDADKSGELPSRRTQTVTRSLLYRKG